MSQAVASVESGLDRILAEEENASKDAAVKPATAKADEQAANRGSSDILRAEASKNNDRLQARLAQAMAKKTPSRSNTPQPVEDSVVGENKDTINVQSQRSSVDVTPKETSVPVLKAVPAPRSSVSQATTDSVVRESSDGPVRMSREARSSTSLSRRSNESIVRASMPQDDSDQDLRVLAMRIEHEKNMVDMQEEVNGYLERIDAMQRNLQLLTKETIQNAKSTKSDVEATSQQKVLAEKDERIALLIEEGSKLAKNELQFRNTIKKLRLQTTSMTKDQDAMRLKIEKAESLTAISESKLRKVEIEASSTKSQLAELMKSATDLDAITKERDALTATLAEVRSQLSRSNKRAEEAEAKASTEKVEVERRKVVELEESLEDIKIEQQLERDKSKKAIEDLTQALSLEKEQGRVMETEMLAEQAALESKLESFRLRAEKASTGDQTDSQAKLLRQIETLQSQYTTATQNWQGIENTLLSRITAIEAERDDTVSHEADLRRKLREATSKAKAAAKDLDGVQQAMSALQDEQDQQRSFQKESDKQISALQQELKNLQNTLDQQRIQSELETTRRIEEERVKWMKSIPQSLPPIESPVASMRRGQHPHFMDTIQSPLERPMSRRSSAHPYPDSNFAHTRLNSVNSIRPNGMSPTVETPSIVIPEDQDDFFANIPATPASMTRVDSGGRLNEVISASTAGAGPSVQLVERLSMTVRRLETEKAASKDELQRLGSQRDEARKEVVNLMREVEQKRAAEERLAEIEAKHKELSGKYEKTLELLGEKSEQVDELKADIADVKDMYRHLADTMGK